MSVELIHKEPPPETRPIYSVVVSASNGLKRALLACEQATPAREVIVQVRQWGELRGIPISTDDARAFAAALVRLADQVDTR